MLASQVLARTHLIEDDELRVHVENGIKVLTQFLGDEWPEKVDADELDVSLPCSCVVGQAFEVCDYNQYQGALYSMHIYATESAYKNGFDLAPPRSLDWPYEPRITYADLTDAWRLVLS